LALSSVAPRAWIDDGLLDVLVVRKISPRALLAAARESQQLPPDGEWLARMGVLSKTLKSGLSRNQDKFRQSSAARTQMAITRLQRREPFIS
jgi:hypothetical protein